MKPGISQGIHGMTDQKADIHFFAALIQPSLNIVQRWIIEHSEIFSISKSAAQRHQFGRHRHAFHFKEGQEFFIRQNTVQDRVGQWVQPARNGRHFRDLHVDITKKY